MNTDTTNHKPVLEETDRRTTEEKIKDFADKARPHIQKLWAARWKILIFNGVVLFLTIIYLFFIAEPYYESTVVILPEYGSKSTSLGQLSELAAMAGVKVGDESPTQIYQNLLISETVLEPVICGLYKSEKFKDSVNLIQYFGVDYDQNLGKELQDRKGFLTIYNLLINGGILTDFTRSTRILTVKAIMPEAKLSADVVNKLVGSLDNYIRTKRKSYAGEQRYYLEMRVSQIRDSLAKSEEALKIFRERNRMIAQSPNLLLEQGRLMRSVEIQQTVFVELSKQLEIAKIDEVKNTPVVNVRENAKLPILKSGPKRLSILLIVFFLSFVLSGIYLLSQEKIDTFYRIAKG